MPPRWAPGAERAGRRRRTPAGGLAMNARRGWIALGVAAIWLGCCAAPAWALIPPTLLLPAATDSSPPVVVAAPTTPTTPTAPTTPGQPSLGGTETGQPPPGLPTPEP